MDEASRRLSERRVVIFNVAGQEFCLPVESVQEIVAMATLARPPAAPAILEGFLNLGGVTVPVVRLANLLGLPPHSLEAYTPILIVRRREGPIALLAQRVIGIAAISADSFLPLDDNDSFNGSIEANANLDGRIIHLLSLDRLLLEKERQTLEEFRAVEAERLRTVEVRKA